MKSFSKVVAAFAVSALALTACSSKTQTADDIKARQDIMQDWRISNDIMKGMTEKPETFDAAAFKEQADSIKASTDHVWSHFADAANKGKAQDAVWSDATGFKAKADEFNAAATALSDAAANAQSADDVSAPLGKLGESCGSCHKAYKQP